MPGVADAWGPGGSGSRWGRWAHGRERRAGPACWAGRSVARVGPACARCRAGLWAEQAEPAARLSSFLFFFCFIFLLLCLNSNLIWSLNSNLVYFINWIFRYEAHNTPLYILGTLFSYFV